MANQIKYSSVVVNPESGADRMPRQEQNNSAQHATTRRAGKGEAKNLEKSRHHQKKQALWKLHFLLRFGN